MKRLLIITISAFLAAASGAFADARPAPVEVPENAYCAECGMRIRGEGLKFVSQAFIKDGKVKHFCDIGDLLIFYYVSKKKEDVSAIYVKDFPSGAWTDGRSAFYLTGAKVVTPMRFGILAFKERAAAEKFRKEKGGAGVFTFDEALASKVFRR